jgi:hypothetical protein
MTEKGKGAWRHGNQRWNNKNSVGKPGELYLLRNSIIESRQFSSRNPYDPRLLAPRIFIVRT